MRVRRLGPGDEVIAQEMFGTLAAVFGEENAPSTEPGPLDGKYVQSLLENPNFWAVAAELGGRVVGGITAHTLPMTRTQASELFIYDLAVQPEHQRQGIGRALVSELLALASAAGIKTSFVPADDEDEHALAFYRALDGDAAPVTIFTFARE